MREPAYRIGLGVLGLAAERLRARKPVIFCFHSVTAGAQGSHSPMAVSATFLDGLVGSLRRAGIALVSLRDALRRIREGDDRPFVALTFDDGYRDNYHHLYPVMLRHSAPFAIFVTTGLVDRDIPMWWDVVDRLCAGAGGYGAMRRQSAASENMLLRESLTARFRALAPEGQRRLVADLARRFPALSEASAYDMALTWPMLREMQRSGLMSVGAHTHTHRMLSRVSDGTVAWELDMARRRIREMLDVEASFLAYPFGQPHEVGPGACRIAREAGFAAAFTTQARPLCPADATRPFELPRILLARKAQRRGIVSAYMSGWPARIKATIAAAGSPPLGQAI